MTKPLASLVLTALLPALPAAAQPAEPPRQAVVLTAVENMYSGPDERRDVVSQALLGQVVDVLDRFDGFLQVQTPDRYKGWMPAGALRVYEDAAAPRYAARGPVVEITSLMAQLYRTPDVTAARPRERAPLGTRLEMTSPPQPPENRWMAVRLPGGDTAYLQAGDGRIVEASVPRPRGGEGDLVATARRFLGVPYVWGGMSAEGVDCSGFVSQVYWANGVTLPRDADMQFDDPAALPVDKAQLRPGDLVFFGKTKVTHVGIYVGEGRFLNATTYQTPMVREDALDDPHWVELYKGARRPGAAPAAAGSR